MRQYWTTRATILDKWQGSKGTTGPLSEDSCPLREVWNKRTRTSNVPQWGTSRQTGSRQTKVKEQTHLNQSAGQQRHWSEASFCPSHAIVGDSVQFPKEYHYEPENGPHSNAHCNSTLYMCRADVGKAALPIALAVSGMSGASGGHAQPIATLSSQRKAQSLTQCQCRTSKTCKLSTSAQHRGQQRNAAHTRATERGVRVWQRPRTKDHWIEAATKE